MSALATVFLATCSWASPGANPYTGSVPAAVDRYTDIPVSMRSRLKARMAKHQYDDVAEIRRDSIDGYTDLRDMHFGARTVCHRPDRSGWSERMVERGLVYCETEHCLIVPTVCRNVSRVTRVRRMASGAAVGGSGGGAAGPLPLGFAPPTAVPSFESMAVADPVLVVVSKSADPWLPVGAWAPVGVGPIYLLPAPVPVVPEPGTWLLMLAGLVAVRWAVRV